MYDFITMIFLIFGFFCVGVLHGYSYIHEISDKHSFVSGTRSLGLKSWQSASLEFKQPFIN